MGKGTVAPGRPFVWRIERAAENPAREVLCFGKHRIYLNDVTAISTDAIHERPTDGIVLSSMIFVVIACGLAFGVFDGPLGQRALLGTAFLAFLAYMGFSELPKLRRQSFFRIQFSLENGSDVTFASANRTETDALLAALALR